MSNIDELIAIVKKYNHNKKDLDSIREAYNFAEIAHKGQKRKNKLQNNQAKRRNKKIRSGI